MRKVAYTFYVLCGVAMGLVSSNYLPITHWWEIVLTGWLTGILYGLVARLIEWLLTRGVKVIDFDDDVTCDECGARVTYDVEMDRMYCTMNPDHDAEPPREQQ